MNEAERRAYDMGYEAGRRGRAAAGEAAPAALGAEALRAAVSTAHLALLDLADAQERLRSAVTAADAVLHGMAAAATKGDA
jgi:hypothetical protein